MSSLQLQKYQSSKRFIYLNRINFVDSVNFWVRLDTFNTLWTFPGSLYVQLLFQVVSSSENKLTYQYVIAHTVPPLSRFKLKEQQCYLILCWRTYRPSYSCIHLHCMMASLPFNSSQITKWLFTAISHQ